uniref:transmembrane and immunoglobulin domain-containing protein 1 n=1 Tax=Monopterus albus TaxID=43700 RepID=UPI0009B4B840|nr:transmembrane and immunoglobulin domain-containing protein 1-like [Monopterus albus]XP_020453996.1 transmembrane and immunoglobulin domain-containing protein 1-like [Monopterus albus]
MKLMSRAPLFHLLIYCATQTFGVKIKSVPEVNSEGVIETKLEETVSLLCLPDGASEDQTDEQLVWLRNGAMVSLREGNNKGSSNVCITPVILEDNGATFTCHLSRNTTVSASVTLNVTYGPLLSGSEQITVEDESVLVLQCDIWANPPVSFVLWTLNGSAVDLVAGGFTVTHDAFTTQLTTNKVKKGVHEGTYQCKADSPLYGNYSKFFHVTITEKTMPFPLFPMIAGLVVVCLTAILAVVARWGIIIKHCKGCTK